MSENILNILIRVSRPELYKRLLLSIDFDDVNVITYHDTDKNRKPYSWNLLCNVLKDQVKEGFFVFADDDDYFRPGALKELSEYLTDNIDGIVCQFLRNGRPKPSDDLIARGIIREGLIGGGCLVLHSKHKNIADWDDRKAADYRWIKAVSEKVKLKFIPLVLQIAGNNGLHGKNIS